MEYIEYVQLEWPNFFHLIDLCSIPLFMKILWMFNILCVKSSVLLISVQENANQLWSSSINKLETPTKTITPVIPQCDGIQDDYNDVLF